MEHTNQTTTTQTAKPRSEAQIAASRANGAKSKGPVTPEGKAISAQNAERHGIFASICTIQGEAPELFASLIADLYETWAPTDEHERALVDTMAMALWRRTRIAALESAGINLQLAKAEIQNPETIHHYIAITSLAEENRSFELLNRYEARFTRMYERAARSLMAYRKFRQQEASAPSASIQEHSAESPSTPEPQIQKQKKEPKRLSRREARKLKRWHQRHPGSDRISARSTGETAPFAPSGRA